jgi:hypothetical protein
VEALRESLRADPTNHRLHRQGWEWLSDHGRLDEAVRKFRDALTRYYRESPQPQQSPSRRRVESTTLCAVDCLHPELTVQALRASMAQCEFESVLLLSDCDLRLEDIEVVRIERIASKEDYSRFLFRQLGDCFGSDHLLMVQWDGYVVDGSRWDDAFLLFDYVGAPWPPGVIRDAPQYDVGNGGFSLRSRSLLQALHDPAITPDHPEDAVICRSYRPYLETRHGVAFAPRNIADRFAYEHVEPAAPTFGFHGVINMARYLPWTSLRTFDFLDE